MPAAEASAHARAVIAARPIGEQRIAEVPEAPARVAVERTDPALRHALWRIDALGGGCRGLSTIRPARGWHIVTAYSDRTARPPG